MVAVGILLSRILGFARNVVLANRLGDSPVADAYEAAFIVPDFLNYLLAGGFLAITFIPILSRYRVAGDHEGAQAAFNAVFRPVAVLVVVLTGVAIAAAGVIVEWLFGSGDRLDPAQLAEVTRLTRLVLPAQVFFVIGGLFMAVQYAHGRFVVPTLAPIIYNAGIIAGGLAGTWSGGGSASGFVLGAVGGGLVGNLALQWWGARRTGLRVTPGLPDFRHPAFREYLGLAVPLMIGQSIVVLDESIGKVVAAAASDGSIFSLNLARRVNMLPVGVIAQAAGVAAYPYLARLVAEGRRTEMLTSMGRTVRMVMFVGGAAVAGVIAVSQPAIRVAFQHGRFSEAGTVLTAAALVGYSLSIPAWGVHQIFGRSFYAHRQMWIPGDRRHGLDGARDPSVLPRVPDRRSTGRGRGQFGRPHRTRAHSRSAVETVPHVPGTRRDAADRPTDLGRHGGRRHPGPAGRRCGHGRADSRFRYRRGRDPGRLGGGGGGLPGYNLAGRFTRSTLHGRAPLRDPLEMVRGGTNGSL